ncbi:MAG: hypothetical protein ABIT76_15190 [Chthoniobacterales bacterium]
MFESKTAPLAPRSEFLRRFRNSLSIGLGLIALSLFIGMAGYHVFERMTWLDSFENASMILSGMGPLYAMKTVSGKLFAGLYAIYSGVALLTNVSIIFAPVLHRLFHKFHLSDLEQD